MLQKSINCFIMTRKLSHLCLKHLVPRQSNFVSNVFLSKFTYCQGPSKLGNDADLKSRGFEKSQHKEINLGESREGDEFRDSNQEDELQSLILKASLPFVNKYGWSTEAVSKGAESLGYSSMIHGMFPNGGINFVNFFYTHCNTEIEKVLKKMATERETQEKKYSATTFIRQAVELRLRMNIEYIDTWPQALALHISPTNASNALHNIGTLMDIIWYYAGDRSTDFNWYTKRGVLAAVYKGTELCMLQDKSEDFQESWKFLDRRLEEIKTFAKCIRQAEDVGRDFGSVGQVGLITALNVLGLNMKSR